MIWNAFVSGTKEPSELAQLLLKAALENGTTDNVT
jgi:hypothetical protein